MNERQQALYKLLQCHSWHWVTQDEIAERLLQYYHYDGGINNFHNSSARLLMTKDIRAINDDTDAEQIILSSAQGIKIADEKEFTEHIKKEYSSLFRKLKRLRNIEHKAGFDGQLTMSNDIVEVFKEF